MSDLVSKCEICSGLIDEEDMFCANCGAEAPQREQVSQPASISLTHSFQCDGCGASMSYDASAGALRCPFCGSEKLTQKETSHTMAPSRVVPFQISQDKAVASMRQWLGRGFWRPGDLKEKALVVKMSAVYVPYWVFEATTHTYWTADSSQVPFSARGDWLPLTGEHHGRHEGLLVGASGALTPAETHALCPFHLDVGLPPDQVDLANVTVETFSVSRKYARPLARQGLERLEAMHCQTTYVPGRARNVKVNTRLEGLASEPVLLPVWIMAYRYHEQVFRFLVNGQTGTATGKAPMSPKKIAIAIAFVIFITLLVVALVAMVAS